MISSLNNVDPIVKSILTCNSPVSDQTSLYSIVASAVNEAKLISLASLTTKVLPFWNCKHKNLYTEYPEMMLYSQVCTDAFLLASFLINTLDIHLNHNSTISGTGLILPWMCWKAVICYLVV